MARSARLSFRMLSKGGELNLFPGARAVATLLMCVPNGLLSKSSCSLKESLETRRFTLLPKTSISYHAWVSLSPLVRAALIPREVPSDVAAGYESRDSFPDH